MMENKPLPLIDTDNTDLKKPEDQNLTTEARKHGEEPILTAKARRRREETGVRNCAANHLAANEREETRIALVAG